MRAISCLALMSERRPPPPPPRPPPPPPPPRPPPPPALTRAPPPPPRAAALPPPPRLSRPRAACALATLPDWTFMALSRLGALAAGRFAPVDGRLPACGRLPPCEGRFPASGRLPGVRSAVLGRLPGPLPPPRLAAPPRLPPLPGLRTWSPLRPRKSIR